MIIKDSLGDGVLVEWDGYQFRLSTERREGDHEIYLDPPVLAAFLRFVERIKQEARV